jgi:predicted dehydrogenase
VICEKPMAMNVVEAREMYERAETAGLIHLIDHELRFNSTRVRIGQLLAEGYLGQVYQIVMRNVSNLRVAGTRHWDWWSQVSKGGGALGANGSHMVDLLRWWIGEVAEVSGQLHTYVTSRFDPLTGDVRPVDSDDQFAISARFVNGVQANVFVSYVAHEPSGNLIEIHGEAGSLVLDNQDRLWGRRAGEEQPTELTLPEPLAGTLGLGQSVWALSFVHLAREAVTAIRERRQPRQGATFYDGMRCQAVLDAVGRSWQDRRWVEVEA